jgi:predicted aspartyl protease
MLKFVVGFLLLLTAAARAEEVCELQRVAVLDSKAKGYNHLMVPAEFGDHKTRLMLDTGGGWSIMREGLAKQIGLKPKKLRTIYYLDVAGGKTTHYVTVPRFTLGGQLALGESDFLLDPDDDTEDLDILGGTIGAERLTDYDIDIDNAAHTVTLYRSDKFCSGRLVRWADKWVEIPYTFNNEVVETKVKVGGEKIRAMFDTGSTRTLMDLEVAKRLFGVEPGSPGVRKEREITMPSGKKIQFYAYHVDQLEVGDLVFKDVEVYLGDYQNVPLLIGMREISQLHLYIAPKRKIIYATLANAGK